MKIYNWIYFIIIISILFIVSCPEQIISSSLWEGEFSDLSPVKGDFRLYFEDKDAIIYTRLGDPDDGDNRLFIKLINVYYLSSDGIFYAEFKDKFDFDSDGQDDKVKLVMDGVLYYSKDYGYGEYDIKIDQSSGNVIKDSGEYKIIRVR